MSTAARLAVFVAALAVVFVVGAAAGNALDPAAPGSAEPSHGEPAGEHGASAVRGLAIADDGVRLVLSDPALAVGASTRFEFRIVDDATGQPVRDFDVTHERRMHLILVRRDLTAFQHLHPELAADGTWSTSLRLDEPGSYRVFADFARGGSAITLATDLRVSGDARLLPLPAPSAIARTDGGLTVTRSGAEGDHEADHGGPHPDTDADAHADDQAGSHGDASRSATTLAFTVTRGKRAVQLEPYLGAGGHLVALREGDLAFLHVHPANDSAAARAAGRVAFAASFPSTGRYRLFLQTQVGGRVHTTAFTEQVR